MINPVNHARTPAGDRRPTRWSRTWSPPTSTRVAPHTGRGGWTWYTGSAGWMYRLIVESLLGLTLEGDRLRIRAVPARRLAGLQDALPLPRDDLRDRGAAVAARRRHRHSRGHGHARRRRAKRRLGAARPTTARRIRCASTFAPPRNRPRSPRPTRLRSLRSALGVRSAPTPARHRLIFVNGRGVFARHCHKEPRRDEHRQALAAPRRCVERGGRRGCDVAIAASSPTDGATSRPRGRISRPGKTKAAIWRPPRRLRRVAGTRVSEWSCIPGLRRAAHRDARIVHVNERATT